MLNLLSIFGHFYCLIYSECPGVPRGPLLAENDIQNTVKLSWQHPFVDGGSPISHYVVDKLDMKHAKWIHAARILCDSTSHVVEALNRDHDYKFRVSAENAAGVGPPLTSEYSIRVKSPYSKSFSVLLNVVFATLSYFLILITAIWFQSYLIEFF